MCLLAWSIVKYLRQLMKRLIRHQLLYRVLLTLIIVIINNCQSIVINFYSGYFPYHLDVITFMRRVKNY